MRLTMLYAAVLAACCGVTMAEEHNITIYSRDQAGAIPPETYQQQINNPNYRQQIPGYAMVRTVRPLFLDGNTSQTAFTGVAAGIDPTTVNFKSLTDPEGTRVLEQNYQYDLVSTERILERYLDQKITIQQTIGDRIKQTTGKLLASENGRLVLQLDNGELFSTSASQIQFPALPDGLITRPTLKWLVNADQSGEHDVQVSYETKGMTWWADYNGIYREIESEGQCELDLSAWVTIVNQAGASFEAAKLKLIAGDVNRAPVAHPRMERVVMAQRGAVADMAEEGFSEKSLFEYHLYTLGRPADLPDRSIKQLELFPSASKVACQKTLVFDAGFAPWHRGGAPYTTSQNPYSNKGDIKVFLEFKNEASQGLGIPLPKGRLRVSQEDPSDGNLEFIGEDNIDHTPRNERLSIKMGNAFDVVGERKQANFRWSKGERWMEETIEVKLRNRKDQAVTVEVRESLFRWTNWSIERASHSHSKRDAASVSFAVDIMPDQEAVLSYTARYTW